MSAKDRNLGSGPRTPIVLRTPVVAALVVALIVSDVVGHSAWERVLLSMATFAACLLVLRFAFGQPWRRLLRYREAPPASDDRGH
jgi:hypothetical protein